MRKPRTANSVSSKHTVFVTKFFVHPPSSPFCESNFWEGTSGSHLAQMRRLFLRPIGGIRWRADDNRISHLSRYTSTRRICMLTSPPDVHWVASLPMSRFFSTSTQRVGSPSPTMLGWQFSDPPRWSNVHLVRTLGPLEIHSVLGRAPQPCESATYPNTDPRQAESSLRFLARGL